MEARLTFDDIQLVPKYSDINSRDEIDLSINLTKDVILNPPIVSSPMDTVTEWMMVYAMYHEGGLGFIHRFMSVENQIKQINVAADKFCVNPKYIGAAVGAVKGEFRRFAEIYHKTKCRLFLIDTAHGHHKIVKEFLSKIKGDNFYKNVKVIAGNVATRQAALDLQSWGADAIRIGIGSGSLCSTRIQTGVGVPMISCIQEISRRIYIGYRKDTKERMYEEVQIPIIADGGIRSIGDVCKAIAAGADMVMLGSLLSGTKETPGRLNKEGMWPNEKLYKSYRGSASLESKQYRGEDKYVEGYSKLVPYKGKVKRIISDIKDGLRSSMSYVGARNIKEFQEKAKFIRVTQNGAREAWPHLL
jgi:IMP dehydrogenase